MRVACNFLHRSAMGPEHVNEMLTTVISQEALQAVREIRKHIYQRESQEES